MKFWPASQLKNAIRAARALFSVDATYWLYANLPRNSRALRLIVFEQAAGKAKPGTLP